MKFFSLFGRQHKKTLPPAKPMDGSDVPLLDQSGEVLDDPILTRMVNHAWNTGEEVIWNEGDDLPEASQ